MFWYQGGKSVSLDWFCQKWPCSIAYRHAQFCNFIQALPMDMSLYRIRWYHNLLNVNYRPFKNERDRVWSTINKPVWHESQKSAPMTKCDNGDCKSLPFTSEHPSQSHPPSFNWFLYTEPFITHTAYRSEGPDVMGSTVPSRFSKSFQTPTRIVTEPWWSRLRYRARPRSTYEAACA